MPDTLSRSRGTRPADDRASGRSARSLRLGRSGRASAGRHVARGRRTDAARSPDRSLPAGKVLAVVGLTLLVTGVLNSAAVVRAGEGMGDGVTRTATLAVARPVDAVASAVGLDLPRRGLDAAFGNDAKTARDGTPGLAERADAVVLAPNHRSTQRAKTSTPARRHRATPERSTAARGTLPAVRRPSPARPLQVFVTGDSLADYVGQEMTNLSEESRLTRVTTVARDGTGLTRPSFFDWQVNAEQEMAERDPDVVVMVIGGNDGWNLEHGGHSYPADSDEWEAEYARRATVVMRTLSDGGHRRVYWSASPTAASAKWNRIFQRQNEAVERAAAAVPGVTYVDLFTGTSVEGRYSDYVTIDGERVLARQADGIHWTHGGAVQPARLVLAAMERVFGDLT